MPNWTHHRDPETDTHHWFECDGSGAVLRQASFTTGLPRTELPPYLAEHLSRAAPFAGSDGAAVTAADRSELDWMRAEFGRFGVELYEARYGVPVKVGAPGGQPVPGPEFKRVWGEARRDRHFTRIVAGPLPVGLRLPGTVSLIPWGVGVTGLFVELSLPIRGFVDMGQLPRPPEPWPAVGTAGTFEVVDVRLNCEAEDRSRPQVRLKPVS